MYLSKGNIYICVNDSSVKFQTHTALRGINWISSKQINVYSTSLRMYALSIEEPLFVIIIIVAMDFNEVPHPFSIKQPSTVCFLPHF